MKEDILIFPYSGTGIEALDCLGESFNCVGFISDDLNQIGKSYNNYKIFDRKIIQNYNDSKIIAVHGSPNSYLRRKEILNSLNAQQNRFCTIIHPSAAISAFAKIGKNVLIMANVSIGPNVIIKDNVIVLPNSTIHHDSILHEYSIICGNVVVAGNVIIEENCYVGAGTSIINNCTIGTNSIIGIGSNVINNVTSNSKVAGNPAKQLN